MTEDETVGWHHRLNGHEFEQAPGDGEGQESLECYSPWGHRVRHYRATGQQQLRPGQGQSLALNDPVLPTCSAFRRESENVLRIVKSDFL